MPGPSTLFPKLLLLRAPMNLNKSEQPALTGYVSLFLTFLLSGLALLTAARIVLLVAFSGNTGPSSEFVRLFATGLRFDLLLLSYVTLPAWLAACLWPPLGERGSNPCCTSTLPERWSS